MSDKVVNIGTLYDMNKSIMLNNSTEEIESFDWTEVFEWFCEKIEESNGKFFMLLCRERYDYTIFHFIDNEDLDRIMEAAYELKECINNRGILKSIELTGSRDAYEIWIQIDDETFAYYLFPYDSGVIEV